MIQSSTRTTQQHARHGFKPRIDRAPIRRLSKVISLWGNDQQIFKLWAPFRF